ncbi:hypothetical protein D3C71_2240220 [compost metagenome]
MYFLGLASPVAGSMNTVSASIVATVSLPAMVGYRMLVVWIPHTIPLQMVG